MSSLNHTPVYSFALNKLTMKYQNKKVAGVWIDHEHAYIVRTNDYKPNGTFEIHEKIKSEHHSERGGSEHTFHHKESQELKKFFQNTASHLQETDALYLFGPGKAQEQFKNYLMEDKHFHHKEITLGGAQHQTPNQLIAQVRNHFNAN
jgi:stalled ribosome rescue protein Dom34